MKRTLFLGATFLGSTALLVLTVLTGNHCAQAAGTVRVMSGLSQPIGLVATPADDRHLFVYQRNGVVRMYDQQTQSLLAEPFVDLRDRVVVSQDGGLVGMAFDPEFADNGYVYLQYIDSARNNQLSRFTLNGAGTGLDPASEYPILYLEQPTTAHNGDWIGFGPDGYLYYTTGDGGDQHDPNNNGQDTSTLLGSILRLDVRNGADDFPSDPLANYGIPATNPFVGQAGRDEIFAFGVRNPWRASFDRLTGDFYIGDTSQNTWEEVNFIAAGSAGGENFGWRLREGYVATPTGGVGGPKTPDMVDPVYAYHHGGGPLEGNSVIGGYVYRGPSGVTALQGQYFFSDYVTDHYWSIEVDPATGLMVEGSLRDWTARLRPDVGSLSQIAGYGEDNLGNLYFVSLNGNVFMLVPEPSTAVLLLGSLSIGLITRRRIGRA
ncbi:MAG: PQQ-dependent sugar dehydrogenase [Pirellulales bacterium]